MNGDKHDKQPSGLAIIDAITKIHGPTAEELRQPFQKSIGEQARDWKAGHAEAVRKFSNGGKV